MDTSTLTPYTGTGYFQTINGKNYSVPAPTTQPVVPNASPISPTVPANIPITSNTIASGNQPITITNPAPATGINDVKSATETSNAQTNAQMATDALVASQQQQAIKDKATTDASLKALTDALTGQKTQSGLTSTEYSRVNDTGTSVNQAAQDLNNINAQILAVKNDTQNKIDALIGTGATQQGIAASTADINRKATSQLADLAVIQQAKQGNYALAKDIADRNVNAQLEEQKNNLDALQLTFTNNKDAFTTSEQRAFQVNYDNLKQKLAKQEQDAKTLSDTKLEVIKAANDNGAPLSVLQAIQSATSAEDAIKASGSYGKDQLKQLQIAKAKVDLANAQGTGGSVLSDITQNYTSFLQGRTVEQLNNFNNLSSSDKSSVAQLVSGNVLLSDLVKSRGLQGTKEINKLIQEATSVDPTFSVNNNKIRYNFLNQWNLPNGKVATVRNAINTALGHLADFKTSADSLDSSTIQKLNSVRNVLSTETGDPKVLQLRTDINALASEVATIYKGGTQPTEQEIQDWKQTIAANFSKSQFQGVADEISKLLSSKITATRYQFASTMGYQYPQTLIDPQRKQSLIEAGITPSVLPYEDTGNPSDNPFGQSIGVTSTSTSSPIFNSSTGMFNIPQ